ncbi:translation initiation factor Sui1 [Enhygromyxa salina]|uniref:Translation initiation factor Sui1 n=1 Tax=Enhygromyxa salina TaxID=215803 RepID=A0A2S9XDD6_9BACT|nr:translation initiation factor [Enhygromyxa salina]PRP90780.1 translation initiation factor Sui1 [Enhygromyxa salina]
MAKRPKITADTAPLTSNPFAGLSALIPDAPAGEPAPSPIDEAPSEPSVTPDLSGRLVVRRQKRGQGGKTVTCVEGLDPDLIPALLTRLKRELGCSGRVDGAVLVAGTGDHGRVASWLRAAGAARVVLGN